MRARARGAALALAICGSLVPGVCAAQSRLSLQQAVEAALSSRALLKAEGERVAVAEGRRRQAGLFPNPELQFSTETLRPGQTYTRDVDTLAYVTWPLDVVGKRGQRLEVAKQIVSRTQAELDLTRRQVSQSVRLAYWAAGGEQEGRA